MNRAIHFVIVITCAFLLFIAFQSIEVHTYSRTIIDDGYYYLNYALNVARGHGPTFDGIVMTNGVQPLWTMLLTLLAWIFPDPQVMLYATLVLSAALAVISAICLNEALKTLFSPPVRVVALLLYVLFISNPSMTLTGMELTVNLATLTLALAAVLRTRQVTIPRLLVIGLLLSLTVLSRVDNLIVSPVFILVLLWRTGITEQVLKTYRIRSALRVTIVTMMPVLGVLLVYLVFNQVVFGRFMPISGDIKAANEALRLAEHGGRFTLSHLWMTTVWSVTHYLTLFSHFTAMLLASFGIGTLLARLAFIILIVTVFAQVIRRRRQSRLNRRQDTVSSQPVLSPMRFDRAAQLTLLLSMLLVFFHTWMIFIQLGRTMAIPLPWYYGPEYVLLAVLGGAAVAVLGGLAGSDQRFYQRIFYALLALGVFGAVTFYIELMRPPEIRPLNTIYQAAGWMNDNAPGDAVIGSFNSGVAGYITDASVINLDGLMNDESILRVIQGEDTIAAYIERMEIEFIMDQIGVEWSPETADHFRGIPLSRLELIYEQPFLDWGAVPMVYYIFRVIPASEMPSA